METFLMVVWTSSTGLCVYSFYRTLVPLFHERENTKKWHILAAKEDKLYRKAVISHKTGERDEQRHYVDRARELLNEMSANTDKSDEFLEESKQWLFYTTMFSIVVIFSGILLLYVVSRTS